MNRSITVALILAAAFSAVSAPAAQAPAQPPQGRGQPPTPPPGATNDPFPAPIVAYRDVVSVAFT